MNEKSNHTLKTAMKRLMIMALCMVIAASALLATGASAAPEKVTDAKYILFDDPGYLDFFSGNQIRFLEYGFEDGTGYARIYLNLMGSDPFIYMPISVIEGGVSCDEYQYCAISVRSPYPTRCNLYFGTSNEGGLDESKNITSTLGISDSTDWETVVFYCASNAKWNGILSTARFDPYGGVPEGMEYIDIRWMAFVKSEKDLEGLDVSLDALNNHDTYTRMPTYSTPNRTRPPENTFRPSPAELIVTENDQSKKGISPAVLISVTAVSVLCIVVCVIGIIVLKAKNKKQNN